MAPAVSERRPRTRAERRAEYLASQRRERARRAARARKAAERRRRARSIVPRLLMAAATFGLGLLWTGAPEPSSEVGLPEATVALSHYRIDYLIRYLGGVINTETHVVSRPYLGLDESFKGGRLTAGQISNRSGLWTWATGPPAGWDLLSGAQQVAVSDASPEAAVDFAIGRGLAAVVGRAAVLGRPCSVVLTGQPLGESIDAPSGSSTVRLCIDRSTGAVLSEVWRLNGKLAEDMEATRFDPEYPTSLATFDPSPRLPPRSAPPIVAVPLTGRERQGLHPVLSVPAGYHLDHSLLSASPSPSGGPGSYTSTLLYSDRSGRVLEADYVESPADTTGLRVGLPGGRTGYLRLDYYLSSLSIGTSSIGSVVLRGSDPDQLIALARQLRW
ncbi:MAG TPA: hypothetical protein VE990_00820 [Acidimicrobiales bacterium]|nr:hypothetical protein [Acidimicrobiales bacterium]